MADRRGEQVRSHRQLIEIIAAGKFGRVERVSCRTARSWLEKFTHPARPFKSALPWTCSGRIITQRDGHAFLVLRRADRDCFQIFQHSFLCVRTDGHRVAYKINFELGHRGHIALACPIETAQAYVRPRVPDRLVALRVRGAFLEHQIRKPKRMRSCQSQSMD